MISVIDDPRIKEKCQIFTPGKIVSQMLDLAGYTGNVIGRSILENSCGDGEFLVEIVSRYIASGISSNMEPEDICKGLERDITASAIDNILAAWKPLLDQKLIKICPLVIKGNIEDCSCDIAEIDLHIILNNFLLNSAWFLEKATVIQREIYVTVEAQATKIIILLENNGPPLDSMFSNNPDRIFFPGESSKKRENGEGTGLGLWITKLAVDGASGEIHPMDKQDGFGLRITLPK